MPLNLFSMSVLPMKWNKITVLATIPTFHQYLIGVDNKLAKKFENNVGMELPELPKEMPPLTEMVASYMVSLTILNTRVFFVLNFSVIFIMLLVLYCIGCTVICTLHKLGNFAKYVLSSSGFFLTSAAEKTKTQGQNSSKKLKKKTQLLVELSLPFTKLKKKTKLTEIF